MGLKEFKEVEIRYAVMGVEVTITKSHIAQLIGVTNEGIYVTNTKESSKEAKLIKSSFFLNSEDFGNVKNMHISYRLLFKILIGCLIPKEVSTYKISWDHRHFIWFLVNRQKINLVAYIFNHLREAIKERHKNDKTSVPYVRLLSELFHKSILFETLKEAVATQDLEESFGSFLFFATLGNMKTIKKKDVMNP